MGVTGKYIAFAGIDGSGKSTQAELLAGHLAQKGVHAILQESKRALVSQVSTTIARRHGCSSGMKYLGEDEYLLCLGFDVMQEIGHDIMPYVQQGAVVVVSRSPYCRLAGGVRRGANNIEVAKEIMLFSGKPDLVIWLDLSPEVACERITKRSRDAPPVSQLADYRTAFAGVLGNVIETCRVVCEDGASMHCISQQVAEIVDDFLTK